MENEVVDLTGVFQEAHALTVAGYRMEFLLEAIVDYSRICKLTLVWDEEEELWGVIENKAKGTEVIFHSELPIIFVDENRYETLEAFIEDRELSLPVLFPVVAWSEAIYKIDLNAIKDIIIWHHSISHDPVSLNDMRLASI